MIHKYNNNRENSFLHFVSMYKIRRTLLKRYDVIKINLMRYFFYGIIHTRKGKGNNTRIQTSTNTHAIVFTRMRYNNCLYFEHKQFIIFLTYVFVFIEHFFSQTCLFFVFSFFVLFCMLLYNYCKLRRRSGIIHDTLCTDFY